jgi:Apea-like HEPN
VLRVLRQLALRFPQLVPQSAPWWNLLKETEAALRGLLQNDPAVDEFQSEHMRADGHGHSRLSMTSLINWLLDRTKAAGPDEAVADLEDYANADTFSCRFSIGIRGVTTGPAIELADDIQLVSAAEDVSSFEPPGKPPMSTAVLTLVSQLPKITFPSTETAQFKDERTADRAFERLQVARMCIAIGVNTRIVETIRTADTTPEVPKSGGRSAASAALPPNVPVRSLSIAEANAIVDLHRRLMNISGKLRDRLVVALHRWHALFLRNGVNADFFIDLGIGLESVFVSERGAEIGYRLAVRGARLLGGSTVASRTNMFRKLMTLYDARSRAVHAGRLLEKIPSAVAPTVGHLAMDGEELLRQAIIMMIYRGRDDWEELVFA